MIELVVVMPSELMNERMAAGGTPRRFTPIRVYSLRSMVSKITKRNWPDVVKVAQARA